MKKLFLGLLFAATISSAAFADDDAWKVVKESSKLQFKAIQNNSPVTGGFESYNVDIHFDPAKPAEGVVKVIVDMGSVTASYDELPATLKTSDWFAVDLFPQAIFTAQNFKKTLGIGGQDVYVGEGSLTIRNRTIPLKLKFQFDNLSDTEATAEGSTTISRTAFGVGQGDWAKTDSVKDEVEVFFTVKAIK